MQWVKRGARDVRRIGKYEMRSPCLCIVIEVCSVLVMLGIFLMSMASAETVVIHPSADAHVYQGKADKNYGNKTWLQVKSKMNKNYRTFIKFDLSSIQHTVTITSARLLLYMYKAPHTSRIYDVHRVTGHWTEAEITWNTQPSVTVSLTDSNSTGIKKNKWLEWDVTSDVQGFVNGSYINEGWMLKDRYENAPKPRNWSRFRSKESKYTAHHPQLVITYTVRNVTSCDGNGLRKDIFDLSDDVYCKAEGLPPSSYVDIYVVNSKDKWQAGDALNDVSDGVDTSFTGRNGSIFTKIWGAPLTQGSYDIVIDVNRNGKWDIDEPIDSKVDVGFEAIPEFPTVAIPFFILLLLIFFFHRKRF